MSNGWIVTSHDYYIHPTPDRAFKELDRLSAKTGKKFHVIRVKSDVVPRAPISTNSAAETESKTP